MGTPHSHRSVALPPHSPWNEYAVLLRPSSCINLSNISCACTGVTDFLSEKTNNGLFRIDMHIGLTATNLQIILKGHKIFLCHLEVFFVVVMSLNSVDMIFIFCDLSPRP